ncbi:hypothetical protein C8R21_1224 [Nitrosospira multiformis]|uniref:DUF6538 domain-containing protein n=1 Tax=Nitrosospira multiformis TaxID=1231 RepID=A0A2T5I7J8_9PROT|nr:DUF6538 domain-containing protein [Nitrosospira multiformis]PTQ79800.1 hypothetical protein C8R21_1224 [Nitrosospira multiformis]
MAIKLPSHLCRSRNGNLYFRIAIPPDLRDYFQTKEIYRSLRTASVRDAKHAVHLLAGTFKQTFERIRQDIMSGKSKKTDKGFEFDFITKIEFDGPPERRTIKSVILQSEPHDTPETIKANEELAYKTVNNHLGAPPPSALQNQQEKGIALWDKRKSRKIAPEFHAIRGKCDVLIAIYNAMNNDDDTLLDKLLLESVTEL